MALPVMVTPEFETTIPSTEKDIKFRPFLVKEEKILFMALQGQDPNEMSNAVKRVLQNCILTNDVDVDSLATFDLEYLFLRLRAKSVGEVIELRLKHREGDCKYVHKYDLNLEDVKVKFDNELDNKVQLSDQVGVVLKYPTVDTVQVTDNDVDAVMDFVADCVEMVYDSDNVYENFSKDEIKQFLESLNGTQFKRVKDFFNKVPKLSHDIEWECPQCGKKERVHLEGLASFFM